MSAVTLQSVVSAWRNFGRWRRPSTSFETIFSHSKDESLSWEEETERPGSISISPWNTEGYANEQMRGLVRQVFLSGWPKPARQVVFSAVHETAEITDLCMDVATTLACEVRSDVCLVGTEDSVRPLSEIASDTAARRASLRSNSGQVSSNLWRLSQGILWDKQDGLSAIAGLCRHLDELKREFEYTVIAGPAAGTHRRAALLGQLCDGVVLVLQADATRRIAARQSWELLTSAGARVLGTVLCDRKFPIPDAIYRRL